MTKLDLRDYRCPEPLIQSKLWLRQAQPGEQLQLRLSDPGSVQDIPRFFNKLGHTVECEQGSGEWLLKIVVSSTPSK